MKAIVAPLMSHEERRRLIRAPFPTVKVHTSSHGWAGVLIRDSVPTEGRRTFHLEPEDEALLAKMTKGTQNWEEKIG